ncbi:sensor histidine kinase [Nonomuraea sp. NPDC050022]|uniref:sensor histidine kinase n=1 Tax=Nonomuraea sp. NPDC050022 TaxID=3364358 RepID=UPI0037B41186
MFVFALPHRGRLTWPLRAVRLAGLVVLLVTIMRTDPGLIDRRPVVMAGLLAAASAGWLLWLASDWLGRRSLVVALLLMGVAGAALTGAGAGVAVAFPAVALIDAGARLPPRQVLPITFATVAATVSLRPSPPWPYLVAHVSVLVACVLLGTFRKQVLQRAEQAELLLGNAERAAQEQARAAALAERSRIAREIHDIQAHALSALSVQLKVVDALVEEGAEDERIRVFLRRAQELADEGLVETRRAILALRDEALPLEELLTGLATAYADRAGKPAELEMEAASAELSADVALTLYRGVQEALTNARKHAPGSPVRIRLAYGTHATLSVVSQGSAAPVGPGFGLRGLRERAERLGGTLSAAPKGEEWHVDMRIPL